MPLGLLGNQGGNGYRFRHPLLLISSLSPQILSHRKPPSSLGVTPAPVPTSLGLPPGPSSYLLPGSLPLGGCGSTPPTPTGLAAASDKREGSSSSEGRGDTDKVNWAWERWVDGDGSAEITDMRCRGEESCGLMPADEDLDKREVIQL